MEESLFEYLERTRAVDLALGVLAVVGPLLVAALQKWGRSWRFVRRVGPDWWLWLAAGPLVYVLWYVYNAIMDTYGLDNLYALILNVAIFMCVGLGLALVRISLWRRYGALAMEESSAESGGSEASPEAEIAPASGAGSESPRDEKESS